MAKKTETNARPSETAYLNALREEITVDDFREIIGEAKK